MAYHVEIKARTDERTLTEFTQHFDSYEEFVAYQKVLADALTALGAQAVELRKSQKKA